VSHLLDTNTIVDHLRRGSASKVTAKLVAAPPGSVFLCSIVIGELVYGAYHSGPSHVTANLALIANLQKQFASLPFDDRAAEEYGKLREYLGSLGLLIGPNDLLIAAIALAHGLTLVTHNTNEFGRVPGLALEDWQA
jgi:tRNA(fMet)-specific endonuclease VapC